MTKTLRELGIRKCTHPVYQVRLIDRVESDEEVICIKPNRIAFDAYLKCCFCGAIFEYGRWLSGGSVDYPIKEELLEYIVLI